MKSFSITLITDLKAEKMEKLWKRRKKSSLKTRDESFFSCFGKVKFSLWLMKFSNLWRLMKKFDIFSQFNLMKLFRMENHHTEIFINLFSFLLIIHRILLLLIFPSNAENLIQKKPDKGFEVKRKKKSVRKTQI